MVKKRTSITIDEDLLEFARHLGLNLSGFLEERLRDLKEKLEGKSGHFLSFSNSDTHSARGEGFEPSRSKNHGISNPAPYQAGPSPH